MGGSESRFMISPFLGQQEEKSYWHAPANLTNDQPIVLTNRMDPDDRFSKVLLKSDNQYVNIRFDQHPQPYVAVGSELDSLVYKDSYGDDCKWFVLTIGIRELGDSSDTWTPLQRNMKLDWDNTKEKEILTIFISHSKKVLTRDNRGNLIPADLPPLSADPINDINLIDFVTRSLFVVQAVDHSWSAHEITWGILGGVSGMALSPYLLALGTAMALGSGSPFFLRYPLEMGEHSPSSVQTLANIGLGLDYVISKLCE